MFGSRLAKWPENFDHQIVEVALMIEQEGYRTKLKRDSFSGINIAIHNGELAKVFWLRAVHESPCETFFKPEIECKNKAASIFLHGLQHFPLQSERQGRKLAKHLIAEFN